MSFGQTYIRATAAWIWGGGRIALREGYAFSDGVIAKPAVSGTYRIVCKK